MNGAESYGDAGFPTVPAKRRPGRPKGSKTRKRRFQKGPVCPISLDELTCLASRVGRRPRCPNPTVELAEVNAFLNSIGYEMRLIALPKNEKGPAYEIV